jgi:hypothetical protein
MTDDLALELSDSEDTGTSCILLNSKSVFIVTVVCCLAEESSDNEQEGLFVLFGICAMTPLFLM